MTEATLERPYTGVMSEMNEQGDTKITWDRDNEDEVAAARASFDLLRGKGFSAFSVGRTGRKGKLITEFDPDAERILLVPQIAGG